MDVILAPLIGLIITVIGLYVWIIVIGVILNWLVSFGVVNTSNRFVYMVGDFIFRATEPVLGRIRRIMPNLGNFDLSPIVLILLLMFLENVLRQIAFKIAS